MGAKAQMETAGVDNECSCSNKHCGGGLATVEQVRSELSKGSMSSEYERSRPSGHGGGSQRVLTNGLSELYMVLDNTYKYTSLSFLPVSSERPRYIPQLPLCTHNA